VSSIFGSRCEYEIDRGALLHAASLLVIFFILLPVAAVVIGSVQSEKALQADTRRVLPLEFTLDNFLVILSKGEQTGPSSSRSRTFPTTSRISTRPPTVILVALLQKYIVEGLAAGAMKG
jgi:ABC-type glycerol-3-phosphate transport system permease component